MLSHYHVGYLFSLFCGPFGDVTSRYPVGTFLRGGGLVQQCQDCPDGGTAGATAFFGGEGLKTVALYPPMADGGMSDLPPVELIAKRSTALGAQIATGHDWVVI